MRGLVIPKIFAKKTNICGIASPDPLSGPAAIPSREPLPAANLQISIGARQKATPRWKSRPSTDGLGERALRYMLLGVLHNNGSLPVSTGYAYDAAGNRTSKRVATVSAAQTVGSSLDGEGRHGLAEPVRQGREDWR